MTNENLCPFPGLRPFNGEESIFFKGRDEHIQKITGMLEANHFIMVTGASGDGKSSIVYAGVIPYAKAGFFKAEFNNWVIADFRPEKSPLENFTKSVNKNLAIDDIEKVESELRLGFSSLIDLYCSSSFYVDQNSNEFVTLDSNQKKSKLKKAANLLILVDQFEEFFTNIENFSNDALSEDCKITGNIILETAAIALARKLPVYIVCTMRSDYIGQCPAFNKLPEFIGFSQFFVPRLKRKELQHVITEPAKLAGCKISNRLTQSLINNLGEGVDQLPVLQHALRQIWKMAEEGREEMDLIHLAKCGGISPSWLNREDRLLFDVWFSCLTVLEKDLLKKPSLENLLNAHANELYYKTSLESYHELTGAEISREECELIIKKVFQCLTLTDQGRMVRNRMTLRQIVQIINKQGIDESKVSAVLYVFRIPGNTFIRPFIDEANSEKFLFPDSILDITHESLIRNWTQLKSWAEEENINYMNFLDFEKQLERWTNNNKTSGYLLPIGPLTYFENWYNKCVPNVFWIERYNNSSEGKDVKFSKAEHKLADAEEFISKSARKLIVTRTMLKYGAGKIAAFFGIIALIAACTYYYFDYWKKQNDYVVNEISERCIKMLPTKNVTLKNKADFFIAYNRFHPGNFNRLLDELNNDTLSFDFAMKVFMDVQNFKDARPFDLNPLADSAVNYLILKSEILTDIKNNGNDQIYLRIGNFMRMLIFLKGCHHREVEMDSLYDFYCDLVYERYVLSNLLCQEKSIKPSPIVLLNCIELILYNLKSKERVKEMIEAISLFENEISKSHFEKLFPESEKIQLTSSERLGRLDHNGGYQIISYLYAVNGNYERLNQCLDSLFKFNPKYNEYPNENFSDILFFLIKYQEFPSNAFNAFIDKYRSNFHSNFNEVFSPVLSRLDYNNEASIIKQSLEICAYQNMSNYFLNGQFEKIWNYYNAEIIKSNYNTDELNYLLARRYKQIGLQVACKKMNVVEANGYYFQSLSYYSKVSDEFKNNLPTTSWSNNEMHSNSNLYIFPCHIDIDNKNKQSEIEYNFNLIYRSDGFSFSFFNYLINQRIFQIFKTDEEVKTLSHVLELYANEVNIRRYFVHESVIFKKMIAKCQQVNSENSITEGRVNEKFLLLLEYYSALSEYRSDNIIFRSVENADQNGFRFSFKNSSGHHKTNNDKKNVLSEINSNMLIEKSKVIELTPLIDLFLNESKIVLDHSNNDFSNGKELLNFLYKSIAEILIMTDSTARGLRFLMKIDEPYVRRNAMIDVCFNLISCGMTEKSFQILAKLYDEIEDIPSFAPKLLRINGMIGGQQMEKFGFQLLKQINDNRKSDAIINYIAGLSWNGQYYKALQNIPTYASGSNEIELFTIILNNENKKESKFMTEIMQTIPSSYNGIYASYDRDNKLEKSFTKWIGNINAETRPGINFSYSSNSDDN